MNGVKILVGRQFIPLAVDSHRFLQLRQDQDALAGRRGRGREESVIAARVQAHQGRRSEAAEPVGFQPFPRERQVQPGADALIEANDFWFHMPTPLRCNNHKSADAGSCLYRSFVLRYVTAESINAW